MVGKERILKELSSYCKKVHGQKFEKWAINQDRLVIIDFMIDWHLSRQRSEIKYLYNHDKSNVLSEKQVEELRKAVEYSEKKYNLKK